MSDDLEACWVTTDIYGQPTDNLVLKAMRRGFRAATKSDCPMACLPDYPGRPKRDENAPITFPGTMLMVRPKAKGEAERNYYRQMNDDQQEAATHRLKSVESDGNEPLDSQYVYARPGNNARITEQTGRLKLNKIEE